MVWPACKVLAAPLAVDFGFARSHGDLRCAVFVHASRDTRPAAEDEPLRSECPLPLAPGWDATCGTLPFRPQPVFGSSCMSMPVNRTSEFGPMRIMLEESNWTSAREVELVSRRSSAMSGAFNAAATTSPESPRRTETSPLRMLMRATARPGSYWPSGSALAWDLRYLAPEGQRP